MPVQTRRKNAQRQTAADQPVSIPQPAWAERDRPESAEYRGYQKISDFKPKQKFNDQHRNQAGRYARDRRQTVVNERKPKQKSKKQTFNIDDL